MLRVLGIGLRLLAWIFRRFPLQRRVVMLSRQGNKPSVDFLMLKDKLAEIDPTLLVIIRCTKPEQHGIMQLIGPMCNQLWYACTSRVVILDGYNPCICIPPKRQGVFVIQLWHAVGAVKKFGYQSLDTPAGRSSSYAKLAHMHKQYDLTVAGGIGAKDAFAKAFGYPTSAISALGLPRIDKLLLASSSHNEATSRWPWLNHEKLNVLYAPTLRAKRISAGWLTQAVKDLSALSTEVGFELIVSKHPLTTLQNIEMLPPQIHVLKDGCTEDLLREVDVVLTDYSAIALEAGLVGTPVFFYVPDIKEYRSSPGLNIDPEKDNRLTAATQASELFPLLTDPVLFQEKAKQYFSFIDEYFAGIQPTATERLAELIYRKVD